MKKISLIILLVSWIVSAIAQTDIPPIAGWKMQAQGELYRFTPENAAAGRSFVYDLMPLKKMGGADAESWFKKAVAADVAGGGLTIAEGNSDKVSYTSGIYTYAAQVKDKTGKSWFLSYVGYPARDDQFRIARMISSPDKDLFTTNGKIVASHMAKLTKGDGFVKAGGSGAGSGSNANGSNAGSGSNGSTTGGGSNGSSSSSGSGSSSSGSTRAPRPKADDFYTENGLKPAQIKGIALNLEYISGVGGGIYPSYEPYLMLNDGSIYSDPVLSPYKFDVAKSRQLEPRKWGTWKAVGKTIVINWPAKEKDKTDTWEKGWFWAKPATNGEKMEGSWGTISGGGNTAVGGNVMIVSSKNFTFNNKGQFTMLSTAGGSNSGDFGVSSSVYSNKDAAGTYVLNGWSLELHYNNGQVQHRNFFFYPDSKDVFGIGTSAYTMRDETRKKKQQQQQ